MKTIFVDAINGMVNKDGTLFQEMYDLLETYDNLKIILTGADDEQFEKYNLHDKHYDVFTLKHNPEKTDPAYYERLLEYLNLDASDTVCFEHNPDAVKSAESVGIKTYHYDHTKRDLVALKQFLDENL